MVRLDHFDILWNSIKIVFESVESDLIAWVVLPDHFHLLIGPSDNDVSDIVKRIKLSFSFRHRSDMGLGKATIWQRRFWDHITRDEKDWNSPLDYIHYNPVKHGFVKNPRDWKFSSIHDFEDNYPTDWGIVDPLEFEGSYGE